jgi:hypothetical protein
VSAIFTQICYDEIMKFFCGTLVIGLLLITNCFSDIKDFELEGMSIGDSFLSVYSKETQKELKLNYNENTQITSVKFKDSDFKIYDEIQVSFKGTDQTIVSISGILYISNNFKVQKKFDECLKMQDKITKSIKNLNPIKITYGPIGRPVNEDFATTKINELILSKNGLVKITCYDFSLFQEKKYNWRDALIVSIEKKEVELNSDEKLIANSDSEIFPTTFEKVESKFITNEKFYALLIANNDYEYWNDLQSPITDVNAIGSILENDYGFEVEILKNVNREEILDKLFEYSSKTSDKDNLLIYYAGHGEIVNTNAYWIPNNGTKEISSKWLNTKDVESAISMIKAKDLLVMIDSCYQGTAFKSGDQKIIGPSENQMNDEKYFKKMLNFRSAVVITSGSNEPVVDAVIKGHSPFAYKFIDILNKNNTYETSTSMFVELKKFHASLIQSPNINRIINWGDLGGDFVFLKKK